MEEKQSFYEKVWPRTFALVKSLLIKRAYNFTEQEQAFMMFDLDVDISSPSVGYYFTFSDAIDSMLRRVEAKERHCHSYHISLWKIDGSETHTFHRICYKEDDLYDQIAEFDDKEFVECIWKGLDDMLCDILDNETQVTKAESWLGLSPS